MIDYILLAIGCYMLLSMALTTKNFSSFFLFKFIPFIAGMFLILLSIKNLGWI